jgi:hypothetical protein
MLRMYKKSTNIQCYNTTDKAENIQRIKRNEGNMCMRETCVWGKHVCEGNMCVCVWMINDACLIHLSDYKSLGLYMNWKTEYNIKQLSL